MCYAEIETGRWGTHTWTPRGGRAGGRNWEIGVDTHTLWVTAEDPLCGTGNSR